MLEDNYGICSICNKQSVLYVQYCTKCWYAERSCIPKDYAAVNALEWDVRGVITDANKYGHHKGHIGYKYSKGEKA